MKPPFLRQAGLAALLGLLAPGCGLVKTATEAPGRLVSALTPGSKPTVDVARLVRERLMRYADLCALELKKSTQAFAEQAGTPAAQEQALSWWIDDASSFWRLASGPQPFASLFDTLLLVSTLRSRLEGPELERWGEAARVMLDTLRGLEANAWTLAAETMDKALLDETHVILAEWLQQDGASRGADVARLPAFADLAQRSSSGSSSLGEFFRIDPLSGLEPAVREVEQVRQLSERALYYLQRTPELIAARGELLILRSLRQPEVTGTLEDLERVSQAAASLAATAQALPESLRTERAATVAQVSDELRKQRQGLVSDLESARAPLVELLAETRSTAEAGRAMSESLTRTLGALDAFVGRFDTSEPAAAPGEPSKPFDVLDYGTAAEKIGQASRDLSQAIATLDASLPELQRVLDEASTRGERGIDHAFARGLQLVLAALLGTAVTVLALRRLAPRRAA